MTLNQFLLSVNLGWPTSERAKTQIVAIDITLKFQNPPKACDSDQLADTYCYHQLTEILKNGTYNKTFRLLEYLTKELYYLTKNYLGDNILINIKATKKTPGIKNLIGGVSFSYGNII